MKNISLFLLLALVSTSAVAVRTNCPSAKVDIFKLKEPKSCIFKKGHPGGLLAILIVMGTKERYSALLTAQATGNKVIVGYSDGDYNCEKTNYVKVAYMVRTFSQ